MNKLSVVLPVLTVMLLGCRGVNPTIEGRQDPYAASQIMYASKELKRKTAVGAPQVARGEDGGILHVTIPVRNTTNRQFAVDYRTKFFDRNGQLLSGSGWQSITLAPNVPDQVHFNSLSPQAADFQMDLRESR